MAKCPDFCNKKAIIPIFSYQYYGFFMVRMTGFEPTRLSTLEPETSASAVPPHPLIKLKIESGKLKIAIQNATRKIPTCQLMKARFTIKPYYNITIRAVCQGILWSILKNVWFIKSQNSIKLFIRGFALVLENAKPLSFI